MQPIPLTVVTGYLGAGKTTLINQLLVMLRPKPVAVIVNELGAVGIDGQLFDPVADVVLEASDGCVCCALVGDLIEMVERLLARDPPPSRIVLETSGVADPGPVLWTLRSAPTLAGRLLLDGVIAVVDAKRANFQALRAPEWSRQVLLADRLVLTKAEQAGADRTAQARALLVAARPDAPIWSTELGAPPLEWALGAGRWSLDAVAAAAAADARTPMDVSEINDIWGAWLQRAAPQVPGAAEDRRAGWAVLHAARSAVHEAGVRSFALRADGSLDPFLFALWLERVCAEHGHQLYRLKGVVAMQGDDRRLVIQVVHRQAETGPGQPWGDEAPRCALVCIGHNVDEDALRAEWDALCVLRAH